MKISLITLLTLLTLVAWALGISQLPSGLGIPVVIGSILTLFLLVIIAAFGSQSKDGKLDVDDNELFKILEPAFKIVSSVLILGTACFFVVFAYLFVMSILGNLI